MQKNWLQIVFGALIAYVLLALYGGTLVHMISEVRICANTPGCTEREFGQGLLMVVTSVGGVVSALVISRLTVTAPWANPGQFLMLEGAGKWPTLILNILVALYLLAWLVLGGWALVVGVLMHPNINQTVADIGTAWLGLMAASTLAYLGVKAP